VKGNHRTFGEIRGEEIEVFLAAAVGVVAVDLEEANRQGPFCSDVAGERAVGLDVLLDARRFQRSEKIVKGGILVRYVGADIPHSLMRINRNDAVQIIVGSNVASITVDLPLKLPISRMAP